MVAGQQLPQFSQYMFNTTSINPAYVGSREAMVVTFLNRNQWVGVSGAPITQTLAVDSSVPKSHLGLGLSLIKDELGYENTTYVYADASYMTNLLLTTNILIKYLINGSPILELDSI